MSGLRFESVLKQSRAYALMQREIANGLSHAYMIITPDDIAAEAFFDLVAASMFCQTKNACGECAECRKIIHKSHSDVFKLNGKTAKTKDFQEFMSSVYIRSLSGRKLYYLSRADVLSPAVQNKLLKTLEEPPSDVIIFLDVANEAGALETIKSRAQKIYLDFFEENQVFNALLEDLKDRQKNKDKDEYDYEYDDEDGDKNKAKAKDIVIDEDACAIAAACSEGMLGKAAQIVADEKYLAMFSEAIRMYETLNKSSDIINVDGLISYKPKDDLSAFLDIMSIIAGDMLRYKTHPELATSARLIPNIYDISKKYSEKALAQTIKLINQARAKLSLNVPAAAVADSLLFGMLEARHKWQQ